MDAATYEAEASIEATHWWFVGRRKLFSEEIEKLDLSNDARILDVGTSTGTNLRMLRDLGYTNFIGLDFSPEAIRFCREKGLGEVKEGNIKELPFPDESFDLVLATDIIEHIDDDKKALSEIERVLRPGGHALFTVPAFNALWGLQDEVSHHQRRYLKKPMNNLVTGSNLKIEKSYYFNFLLFVPIWTARQLIRILKLKLKSENQLNSPVINRILTVIFEIDRKIAPKINLPFGVSIFTLASRKNGSV